MALSIDHLTKVISVPQADLALISGTLYELDTEGVFRQGVLALLDDEAGIVLDDAISHNTQVTVAGTTFARTIEVINGFSVTFTPDAQYTVRLAGSNNNIFDVENAILNQNQVQVISQNSAGLITVTTGSGVLPSDVTDIKNAVWNALKADFSIAGSFGVLFREPITSGTAQSGSGSFITLATSASTINLFYEGCIVRITGGTGAGQHRPIRTYSDVRVAGIYPDWRTIPDNTSVYEIWDARVTTSLWGGTPVAGVNLPTAGNIPVRVQSINNATFGAGVYTAAALTEIADRVFAQIMENSETFAEQVRLMRAEAAGKVAVAGAGTNVKFRDAADSKDRINATVDANGQRTAVTTDGT